jgi:hypothetical protein
MFTKPKSPSQNHIVHDIAVSSKTGLESALQDITKSPPYERLWQDLKQLSSIRKSHGQGEAAIRAIIWPSG